jgi:hypothetical protein
VCRKLNTRLAADKTEIKTVLSATQTYIATSSLILQSTTAWGLFSFQYFNLYCIHLFAEDILSSPEALWGSPDGTHIMYASFNDSEVRILAFPWFGSGSTSGSFKGGSGMWTTFPESRTVRYPTVSYGARAVLSMQSRFYTKSFCNCFIITIQWNIRNMSDYLRNPQYCTCITNITQINISCFKNLS